MKIVPIHSMRFAQLAAAGMLALSLDAVATAQDSPKADGALVPAAPAEGWEQKAPVGGPALSFTSTTFNFGKVDEGTTVDAEFAFVNTSDRVVRVIDIKSSCGCTATQLAKREFAPGEGEIIRANFNTLGRTGQQSKTVTVRTDDPARAVYQLELTGEVSRKLFLEDRVVNFGDVDEGKGGTATLNVVGVADANFKILNMTSQDAGIKLTAGDPAEWSDPKTGEKGTVIPVEVAFDADRPVGNITGSISIQVQEGGVNRNLIASMRGRVVGDVMASPSIVSFGIMKPAEEKVVTLDLSVRGNSPFTLTETTFESQRGNIPGSDVVVSAEVVPHVSMPSRQQIKVTLKVPDAGRGAYRGNVVLTGMANDKQTSLTLPITAVVRDDQAAATTTTRALSSQMAGTREALQKVDAPSRQDLRVQGTKLDPAALKEKAAAAAEEATPAADEAPKSIDPPTTEEKASGG